MIKGIGYRIKQIRKAFELKQIEFAEKTKKSQKAISRYENEEAPPDLDFLNFLIHKMRVNPNWLITGQGDMLYRSDETESIIQAVKNDNDLIEINKSILHDPVIKTVLHLLLTKKMEETEINRQLNILKSCLKK